MTTHIFTYGSLMFPQVWRRVVRGVYHSATARLDGHARFAIRGETYPGAVAQAGASIAGVLYFDVSPRDVAILDAFEGIDYRRDIVCVTLDSGETVSACGYIYLLAQKLSDLPWLPEKFQMERFIGAHCRDELGE